MIPLIEELRTLAKVAVPFDGRDDPLADLLNRAADAIEDKLVVTLHDAMDPRPHDKAPGVECRITADLCGIYLRPKGYGDYYSPDGEGAPAMIEFHNGELRLVVWDDINEDYVQYISLEGAREDAREEDDNQDTSDTQGDTNG